MRRGQLTWIIVVFVAILASIVLLYPSVEFYTQDREALKDNDPKTYYTLRDKALRLGLDLQGGVHMVLQVKDPRGGGVSSDIQDQVLEKIRIRVDKYGITEPEIVKSGTDEIVVDLPGFTDVAAAKELIGNTAQLQFHLLRSTQECQTTAEAIDSVLALTLASKTPATEKTTEVAVSDSTQKEIKELFGQDTSKDTTAQTASEEDFEKKHPFTSLLDRWVGNWWEVTMENFVLVKKYLNMPEVKAAIPSNYEVTYGTRPVKRGDREFQSLYFLNKNIEMTGEPIVSVKESFDQFRRPVVNFELSSQGARTFSRVTGQHINEPLAIVIDSLVESAPNIESRISNRGQITMGGDATINDAYLLSVLLKAGALPADVQILQSTVVGPALGQDSINRGKLASLIGLILVVAFMGIYYKVSGIIADAALLLNILFLLAFMVIPGVNSTLTMPGIAGIILTVGMAVDSNVLIFERIREEMRTGKTIRASIDAGYDRALLTIIDSHVTTLITALFLFIFGSGPIRGFAVTLSVGIFLSLFTALFITKVIFDMRKKYRSLSI